MIKGTHVLLSNFASYFSNYVGLPIFQNFRYDFFTQFSYKFNPRFGAFRDLFGVFTDFFSVYKIHPFGRHIPVL